MERRRFRSCDDDGVEEEKRPSFFKIIMPGFNTEHLRIPPKFWKHMKHELTNSHNSATLRLKNSLACSWTVKVTTSGRKVYFKDGWQEFSRDNSLGDYELLVFRYEKKMHFTVNIFDKDCVERGNVANIRTHEASNFPSYTKKRGRPPLVDLPYDSAEEAAKVLRSKGGNLQSSVAAASFRSKFPYFVKVLAKLLTVTIPTHFCRKILYPRNYDELFLVTPKRRFRVNLAKNFDSLLLSGGWSDFKNASKLKAGDVCIFELVKENTMVVHIFQN